MISLKHTPPLPCMVFFIQLDSSDTLGRSVQEDPVSAGVFGGFTICTPVLTEEAVSLSNEWVSEGAGVFLWSHGGVVGSDLTTSFDLQDFKMETSDLIETLELVWLGGAEVVLSEVLTGHCIPLGLTKPSTGPLVVRQF